MTVTISKVDAVNIRVDCEASVAYELAEHFSFEVKDAKFHPKVKMGVWDGIIRLFNPLRKTIYAGLAEHVKKYCGNAGYEVEDKRYDPKPVTMEELKAFFADHELLTEDKEPRDYQWDAVLQGINDRRRVLLSPTASGKSLIIYMLLMWHYMHDEDFKALVIVPTISLVSQMESDFESYKGSGWAMDEDSYPAIHKMKGGTEKTNKPDIIISTWQSAAKMDPKWFAPFTMVIGDEAHLFSAKSLTTIMTNLKNAYVRIGTTGTLDGSQTNQITLEGLFGPVHTVTTTFNLMEAGHVAQLKIKSILLKYNDNDTAFVRAKCKLYIDEVTFLINHIKRNEFLAKLCTSLEGNTLLLFKNIDHGKHLFTLIKALTNRNVYLIYGKTDDEAREEVRKLLQTETNAIVVASVGTTSTGTNIPSLKNMILAHPSKSRIRTLQSIGRTLRLHADKDFATVYDIADDFRKNGKGSANHTLRHFIERVRYYDEQRFDLTITNYKVK